MIFFFSEFSVIDDRIYTFAEAQQKCKMIDYYSVKDDPSLKNFTIEEKTFWTNIRRFSTQRWVDNTTDIDALKGIENYITLIMFNLI